MFYCFVLLFKDSCGIISKVRFGDGVPPQKVTDNNSDIPVFDEGIVSVVKSVLQERSRIYGSNSSRGGNDLEPNEDNEPEPNT